MYSAHLMKLVEYCETAVNEGATLVHGGKRCDMPGLYMEPTVICDVHDHMWVAHEESFGPIMVISKFDDGWAFFFFFLLVLFACEILSLI